MIDSAKVNIPKIIKLVGTVRRADSIQAKASKDMIDTIAAIIKNIEFLRKKYLVGE